MNPGAASPPRMKHGRVARTTLPCYISAPTGPLARAWRASYCSGLTTTALLVPVLVGSSTLVAVMVQVPSEPK